MAFDFTTLLMQVSDTGGGVASAALSGATPTRTLQLYRAPWGLQAGNKSWTLAGSATADAGGLATITNTVSLSGSGIDYYQWLGVQLTPGGDCEKSTSVAFRPLVDASASSVWERCITAVHDLVVSLNLSGLTSDKIIKRWWPINLRNVAPVLPSITVAPIGPETYPNQLNNTDDVGYPVMVMICDALNRESVGNMTRDLLWRQQIMRAFRFQRLAGVGEVYWSECAPDTVLNPQHHNDGYLASGVMFRFLSRELRGAGA